LTNAADFCDRLTSKINGIKSNCSPSEAPYISVPGLPGGCMMFYSIEPLTDTSVILLGIDINRKPAYYVSHVDQFTASIFISDMIMMLDARPPLGFRSSEDLP
jgi:hypothetical protein